MYAFSGCWVRVLISIRRRLGISGFCWNPLKNRWGCASSWNGKFVLLLPLCFCHAYCLLHLLVRMSWFLVDWVLIQVWFLGLGIIYYWNRDLDGVWKMDWTNPIRNFGLHLIVGPAMEHWNFIWMWAYLKIGLLMIGTLLIGPVLIKSLMGLHADSLGLGLYFLMVSIGLSICFWSLLFSYGFGLVVFWFMDRPFLGFFQFSFLDRFLNKWGCPFISL